MRKGKLIIDYESYENGKCKYKISQSSNDELNKENIVSLLEYVVGDLISDQF